MPDTIWNQCLFELVHLSTIRLSHPTLELEEVDRLALLVTKDLKVDASNAIRKIISKTVNGFEDDIPF